MIKRKHTHIEAEAQSKNSQAELFIRHIIAAYGFLLPVNQELSWAEFAELIKNYYSLDNPINEAFYKFCLTLD